LITRIEEVLDEVEGTEEITSQKPGWIYAITTEFGWGTDVDARLVDVLNKLQQVEELPRKLVSLTCR